MNLLLDTHTLLWFITGDSRLNDTARHLIDDAENDKFVSVASLWEMAIKVSSGKLILSAAFDDLFPHQLQINGFELLSVKVEHASIVSSLPFHHRDPFDRLLVAQSTHENLTLVSVDQIFDEYGITRLW